MHRLAAHSYSPVSLKTKRPYYQCGHAHDPPSVGKVSVNCQPSGDEVSARCQPACVLVDVGRYVGRVLADISADTRSTDALSTHDPKILT